MGVLRWLEVVVLVIGAWTVATAFLGDAPILAEHGIKRLSAVWSDVQVLMMDPEESYEKLQHQCTQWELLAEDPELIQECAQLRKAAAKRRTPPLEEEEEPGLPNQERSDQWNLCSTVIATIGAPVALTTGVVVANCLPCWR